MEFGIVQKTQKTFDDAVESVKKQLIEHEFGILTEIDVAQTLKKKMDADLEPYIILGACHPQSAYAAIQAEPLIGLMLPCNVIVFQKEEIVYVAAIKPTVAMQMIENVALKTVAHEIESRLARVVQSSI